MRSGKGIAGLVFDKDGTLFDFEATWGDWAARLLTELCGPRASAKRRDRWTFRLRGGVGFRLGRQARGGANDGLPALVWA